MITRKTKLTKKLKKAMDQKNGASQAKLRSSEDWLHLESLLFVALAK